ncbi:hypothetical protein FQA39_LY05078 [Lamprigera yunnana]|nr:hypothetical protein FQA39_LY05078 [Lamprigera yunnana]
MPCGLGSLRERLSMGSWVVWNRCLARFLVRIRSFDDGGKLSDWSKGEWRRSVLTTKIYTTDMLRDVAPAVSEAISSDSMSATVSLAATTDEISQRGSAHSPAIEIPSKENVDPVRLTSLADIIPLPKIKTRRKRKGKGLKSELLTSTPNKERMEEKQTEKEAA